MSFHPGLRVVMESGYSPRVEMRFTIEVDRETDGRWIAEIADLPGVLVYGDTRDSAISKVQALALRVLADRLEHNEMQSAASVAFESAA